MLNKPCTNGELYRHARICNLPPRRYNNAAFALISRIGSARQSLEGASFNRHFYIESKSSVDFIN